MVNPEHVDLAGVEPCTSDCESGELTTTIFRSRIIVTMIERHAENESCRLAVVRMRLAVLRVSLGLTQLLNNITAHCTQQTFVAYFLFHALCKTNSWQSSHEVPYVTVVARLSSANTHSSLLSLLANRQSDGLCEAHSGVNHIGADGKSQRARQVRCLV